MFIGLTKHIKIQSPSEIIPHACDAINQSGENLSTSQKRALAQLHSSGRMVYESSYRLGNNGYSEETGGFTKLKREDLEAIFRIPRVIKACDNNLFNLSPREIAGLGLNTNQQKLATVFNTIDTMFRIDNARTLQTISNQDEAIRAISTAIEELKLSMKSFMDDLRNSDLGIPERLIDYISKRWLLNETELTPQVSACSPA